MARRRRQPTAVHERRYKRRAAPAEERTYRGRLYASKAERVRACELDLLKRAGEIDEWEPQVTVALVPGFAAVIDFRVTASGATWYEEVKGNVITQRWRDVVSLWRHHGPAPLHVYNRVGQRWQVTELEWPKGR